MGLKIAFMGASFLIVAFLYFIQIFPQKNYFPGAVNFLLIGSLIAIGLISVFSDLIVSSVNYSNGVLVGKEYGILYPVYAFLVFSSLASGIVFSVVKYKKAEGIVKRQAQYILLGMSLSFISGLITNLFFPLFKIGSIYISQYGPICLYFFAILSALAITRYHLFEIKLILTESLVVVAAIPLILLPFLMPSTELRILAVSIFVFSSLIGCLLIKNTYREVKAKETLEQKVQERTKELDQANQGLKERQEEVEKWYKLTIGRELRMAELKEKIKEVEEKQKA
jgi:hypothetical protein